MGVAICLLDGLASRFFVVAGSLRVSLAAPRPTYIDDLSRRLCGAQGLKSLVQHGGLLIGAAGLAQRVAEGPAQEDRSRRFDFLGVGSVDGDADGRNSAGFYDALDQSHGLMADASGRCQQYHVHLQFLENADNLVRGPVDQGLDMAAVNMAHERKMHIGDSPDATGGMHLFEPGDGKDNVQIPVGIPVVVIIMGNFIVAGNRLGIDDPKSGIPFSVGHIKRLLVFVMDACSCHQGDLGLRQGFVYRAPWDRCRLNRVERGNQFIR